MEYRLEDVPRYQNGSVRPRLADGIFPQARGLHFVFGTYNETLRGVPVVLFDGDERVSDFFLEDRFNVETVGDMTWAEYIMQALLATYAWRQVQIGKAEDRSK